MKRITRAVKLIFFGAFFFCLSTWSGGRDFDLGFVIYLFVPLFWTLQYNEMVYEEQVAAAEARGYAKRSETLAQLASKIRSQSRYQ